jgi:hypothetical protein
MKTYLIQSIQTPQEFWSNNLGWVSIESADRFTGILLDSPAEGHRAVLRTENGSELGLPLGGKWILDFVNPYQCGNCEHTDEYRALPEARDLLDRLELGETYTDVECPQCGALCFSVDTDTPKPAAPVVVVPPNQVFSETEMFELLEIARLALRDADFFDMLAEGCDLSDDYLIALRDKLQAVMDSDVQIFDRPDIVPANPI